MVKDIEEFMLKEIEGKGWNWEKHIKGVVKYGKELLEEVDIDKEVVELACWLHDIAKVRIGSKGKSSEHHLDGAQMAYDILIEKGYPTETAEAVKDCITTHSSDDKYPPKTKEQKVVASADALSHFDMFWDLNYFCFHIRGYSVPETKKFMKRKYTIAWKKLIPQAKERMKKKYQAIMFLLEE
jgi:uncharacterized protein